MLKLIKKYIHFILLFIIVFLFILSITFLDNIKQNKIKLNVQEKLNSTTRVYNSTFSRYETLTKTLYKSNILANKKIKSILLDIKNNKNKAREELYIELKDSYEILNKENIFKFHFHLKNNESFLRFDKPELYGDDLSTLRKDVAYVNKTKKTLINFHTGINFYSLRFIYPIIIENEHIGSVEYGISIKPFISMAKKEFNKDMYFFVNETSLSKMIQEDSKEKYFSTVLDNYYISGYNKKFNIFQRKLLKHKKEIFEKLKKEDPFYIIINNHTLSFIPVKNNINNKIESFFLTIEYTKQLKSLNTSFIFIYIVDILITLFLLLLLFIDIKIKKQNKEHTKRIETLLNNQKALVILTNGDNLIDANNQFFEFLGFENINKFKQNHSCICDFFEYEKDKNYIQKINHGKKWDRYILDHKSDQNLVKIKSAKNSYHIFEITLTNFDDNYIVNFYDITKQKELEQKLFDINQNLENIIIEEVSKNHQKDIIIQKQKKAVEMVELISMIAHQWRQPLASIATVAVNIKLKLELKNYELNTKKGQDDFLKFLNTETDEIENLIEKLTKTIDDFRNYYKLTDKQLSLKIEDVIEHSLKSIKLTQKKIKPHIITQYKYKGKVNIYQNELSQVLTGIFENSIDAFINRKIDDPKIIILTYELNDKLYLEIEDNALGIDENIIEKVFDPYFSTKNNKNGTGLSLNMAKIVIEHHHNGIIDVKNINKGVRFTITLPIK